MPSPVNPVKPCTTRHHVPLHYHHLKDPTDILLSNYWINISLSLSVLGPGRKELVSLGSKL